MTTIPSTASERIGVTVSPTHLQLALGERADVTVMVQNRGTFVDQFELQVEGVDPAWITQHLVRLSLFPGDEGRLDLALNLPADRSIPAGLRHARLKVFSWHDPRHATTAELAIEVLPVGGLELSLAPRLVTTRRTGHVRVMLANVSNAERVIDLTASDPDEALDLALEADRVGLAPGATEEVGLRVGPRRRRLIAPPQRFAFAVTALPAGVEAAEPMATAEGTLIYRAPLVFVAALLPLVLALLRVGALMAIVAALGAWVLGSPSLPGPTVEETRPTRTPIVLGALLPPTPAVGADGESAGADAAADGSATPGEAGAGGPGTGGDGGASGPPQIARFDLSVPPNAQARELELNWQVEGADEVVILGTPQPTAGSLRLPNPPEGQIDLLARNSAGEVTRTIGLLVLRAPEVLEFLANPNAVLPGQPTRLNWQLRRADTATLFGPGLPSTGQAVDNVTGQMDVVPDRTGTYRLVAENDLGRIERLAVVRVQGGGAGTPGPAPGATTTPTPGSGTPAASPVAGDPFIEQFGVVAQIDNPAGSLPLEWQVTGADEIRLVRTDPVSETPQPYQVLDSTEYMLQASNGSESVRESLTLYVLKAPIIDRFDVDRQEIRTGEHVRLSWQVSGADRVFLDGETVSNVHQGIGYSRPLRTHEYVLRAENAVGYTARRVRVEVKP